MEAYYRKHQIDFHTSVEDNSAAYTDNLHNFMQNLRVDRHCLSLEEFENFKGHWYKQMLADSELVLVIY